MNLLIEHWDLILVLIVASMGVGFMAYKWISQPTSKQKEQIKAVLLQLVVTSEKKFGSKTGKIKFSFVYAELIKLLPYLKFVPLAVIEDLIEESLVTMRKLLESNVELKKIVEGSDK